MDHHILTITFSVAFYAAIGISYNLVAGHGGMLSLSHATYVGVGAYVTAMLVSFRQFSYGIAVPAGLLVAACVGVLFSWAAYRLRDDTWTVATLGFHLLFLDIVSNLEGLTNGMQGIGVSRTPSFLANVSHTQTRLMLSVGACLVVLASTAVVAQSAFGRVLRASREDEVFVRTTGIQTGIVRGTAVVTAGILAALVGCIYGPAFRMVKPENFALTESLLVVGIVMVGGLATHWGPIVGAIILVGFPEVLRLSLNLPASLEANFRKLFFGVALVALVWLRPQGVLNGYHLSSSRNSQR